MTQSLIHAAARPIATRQRRLRPRGELSMPSPADAAVLRTIGLAFGAIALAVALLAFICVVTNVGAS